MDIFEYVERNIRSVRVEVWKGLQSRPYIALHVSHFVHLTLRGTFVILSIICISLYKEHIRVLAH